MVTDTFLNLVGIKSAENYGYELKFESLKLLLSLGFKTFVM